MRRRPPPPQLAKTQAIPTHAYIDSQAVLAKQGSESAIRNITGQLFQGAGLPSELTNAFAFNERVVQAELNYRKGLHSAVQTTDVVKAINNLANTIGAPVWAHTNTQEVTKLRMWMLILYPHLIANPSPRQTNGKFEILSPQMSPLEATFIAATLVEQKLWNGYYQLAPSERTTAQANRKLSTQRGQELRSAIAGGTQGHSVRDLLHVADGFFTDLRIDPLPAVDSTSTKGVQR
ncbi:MAG: hypothetical protein ACLQG3_12405 [Terracidiphilus sp.]